jgi:hypothetical protein
MKKFVKIDDNQIGHVWCADCPCVDKVEECRVPPTYFQESGEPSCGECGVPFWYSHTEIKPVTITVHVRGGVAYPPRRLPKHVNLRIVDHDNR